MSVYDNQFNANEWFIIILWIVGYTGLFLLRRKFQPKEIIFLVTFGIYVGFFFDHTISVPPLNFYDVNDNSKFQIMDFISYLAYGPFAVFFIYFWKVLKLKRKHLVLYILIWSTFSVLLESVGAEAGVYHYRLRYNVSYSFPFYVFSQWLCFLFYEKVNNEK